MNNRLPKVLGAVCLLVCASAAAAESRFVPDSVWPDNNGVHINAHGGGVLYYHDAYYWFGEHKTAGRRGNTAQVGVGCYSSKDLYNWKDEGIALAVSSDPNSEIVRGCIIERPKVVYNSKTNTFVMWFHLELRGQGYRAARTGLAVSDSVTGPYRYLRSFRPNARQWPVNAQQQDKMAGQENYLQRDFEIGQMARDMTVFVDDDGKAYHIHAAEENYTLHISELTDDYLDFTGRYARVLPWGHNEAPAVVKHQGRYYLLTSGCTGWAPNAARSAAAEHIFGPWTELGNPCRGVNPHNNLGPEKTFGGQSTFILPVQGKKEAYIAMFDVWVPSNPIDGRYIWLPVRFEDGRLVIEWLDEWDLSVFDKSAARGIR
ncbi:MAG TPA: glycoside hydrolase family 43 protein [Anaerohalosphaeraceae bacterium]|nr:glycoside hydrolase family 43 protein [Anaerohalosphaeraceae bacterium]HOL31184.1 glycoside hydrolase family 43 protein [Anaerohalosphaeraceae bacterium]HOM76008.1 glycoside hydrolase family 43 protein [Anaerohalosphaeraceae bacterium]HPC64592.1 glycoside hydrolase family 43 protein [Anaerohalosphaeraceae bacterium]HPO70174.1 glycoside hydrolase family 43 protein [Anaerohalosphaeraceae bacterium]